MAPERIYVWSERGDDEKLPVIDMTRNPFQIIKQEDDEERSASSIVEGPTTVEEEDDDAEGIVRTMKTEQEPIEMFPAQHHDGTYRSPMTDPPMESMPDLEYFSDPCLAIENPVSISDLHATIYSAMGISPKLAYEVEKRPFYVTEDGKGTPVRDVFRNA